MMLLELAYVSKSLDGGSKVVFPSERPILHPSWWLAARFAICTRQHRKRTNSATLETRTHGSSVAPTFPKSQAACSLSPRTHDFAASRHKAGLQKKETLQMSCSCRMKCKLLGEHVLLRFCNCKNIIMQQRNAGPCLLNLSASLINVGRDAMGTSLPKLLSDLL